MLDFRVPVFIHKSLSFRFFFAPFFPNFGLYSVKVTREDSTPSHRSEKSVGRCSRAQNSARLRLPPPSCDENQSACRPASYLEPRPALLTTRARLGHGSFRHCFKPHTDAVLHFGTGPRGFRRLCTAWQPCRRCAPWRVRHRRRAKNHRHRTILQPERLSESGTGFVFLLNRLVSG